MSVISIKNACKKFNNYTVLDGVSLEIDQGMIFGIAGNNGSGKTVLMKSVCGFLPLDNGEIYVRGKCVGRDIDIPENLGIIIETPGFLPNYGGFSNLWQLAKICGKISKNDVRAAIKKVGLNPDEKKHVGKYSLGMRQRLGIAQAIMEDPDILILDEPMNGLDEGGVEDIRRLLLQLKAEGKSMMIASHNSADIDILCDTVCEMEKGKIKKIR